MKSFFYACSGLKSLTRTEHNVWVHAAATVVVIALSIFFQVSRLEVIGLVFAIGFVWVAEIINTVIEKLMDFISREQHPAIKRIKDMSAAAVLVASLVSLIIGCIVFIPKFTA